MQKPNYQRMYDLIDAVFSTRQDPDQLQVGDEEMKKLEALHPATLSEMASDEGPLIWVLLIPTSKNLMQEFVKGQINEKELLERSPVNTQLDSLYLCSVTALPEVREQGLTKALCLKAIRDICKDLPIQQLFVWPFTNEGSRLARFLALETGLPLLFREHTEGD